MTRDTCVGVDEFLGNLTVDRSATADFCHGTYVLPCEQNACGGACVNARANGHEAVDEKGVNEPFVYGI